LEIILFPPDSSIGIVTVKLLLVVPGMIKRPLLRAFLTFFRTGPLIFPGTFMAKRHMQVTGWVGAVHHAVAVHLTNMAFGYHLGVYPVYLNCHPAIKNVTLPLKVFPTGLQSMFYDTSM
jgi:hypothetical protein